MAAATPQEAQVVIPGADVLLVTGVVCDATLSTAQTVLTNSAALPCVISQLMFRAPSAAINAATTVTVQAVNSSTRTLVSAGTQLQSMAANADGVTIITLTGQTFVVAPGATLTVTFGGTLTNNGTIKLDVIGHKVPA